MSKPLRVALLIESSRSYGRNLLAGIAAYARVYGPWTFYHEERALGDPAPATLWKWKPDCIIARMENPALIRQIRRWRLPTVDVLQAKAVEGIPSIIPDPEATVRLAVEHLLERRLSHFAYCGLRGVGFSEERRRLFVEQLSALGHRVHLFAGPGVKECPENASHRKLSDIEADAMRRSDDLAAWLRALPKPVGLMACNDMRAYQVLTACRECGILVPDEVAVIGVDNDAVQCELCDPPLSSVDNDSRRVGYEAAAMLHRMLQGKKPPALTYTEPAGVVARRSTDVLAIADREMVEIVRYVRDHSCQGLTPEKLARHTAVSRSTLERWFAKHLGRSINAEICRVKLDRVKELLRTSDLPLCEIARLSGFAYSETMQRAFKSVEGETPGQYRSRRRLAGAGIDDFRQAQ